MKTQFINCNVIIIQYIINKLHNTRFYSIKKCFIGKILPFWQTKNTILFKKKLE